MLGDAWQAIRHVSDWDWTALLIAAGTAVVLVAGRRIHQLFPGVLLAVVAGIVLSETLAGLDN